MDSAPSRVSEIYQPLNAARQEFWILHLQPSKNVEDELHCSLEISPFLEGALPEYEAISYCWGEVAGNASIYVDRCTYTAPASAVKALKRFRWPEQSRMLWTDALCIDQSSTSEKEQQIPLMGKMFSMSQGTLVWLGDEDQDTSVALKTIENLNMREGANFFFTRETR